MQRWVLAGTDYVYPRTTNKILEAYLKQKGVKQEDIMINYTPFGHSDWQSIVAEIKKFGSAGKKTAVVSTINGDANVPFYKELGNAGIKAKDIPVVAFSVGEEELAGIDTKPLVGHLAAWNYFQSVKNPTNEAFIKAWQTFTKNPKRVTNDPMEAHVIGFKMWIEAVKKAGTTDPDAVIDAMIGITVPNLSGGYSAMMPNHHITKPVLIGEIQANGQFDMVWQTPGLVVAEEWSPYLPDSKDLIADWTQADELRQLQRRHRQVRRQGQVRPRARNSQGRGDFRVAPFSSPGYSSKVMFFLRLLAGVSSALAAVVIAATAWAADLRPS